MAHQSLPGLLGMADQAKTRLQPISHLDQSGDHSEFSAQDLHKSLVEAGDGWARADKEATLLEETKRALNAALVLTLLDEAKTAGQKLSKADAELMAVCDIRYLHHIGVMVQARKQANAYRIRYDSTRKLIDMLRTQEANHRAAATSFAF